MTRLIMGAAALSAAAGIASGDVRTINFDTDALGNPIADQTELTNQYAAWGVTFTPNTMPAGAASGSGSSANVWAGNTDMGMTFSDVGSGTATGVNTSFGTGNMLHAFGLGDLPGWLKEDGDANFRMSFALPVSTISISLYGLGSSKGFAGFQAYHGSTLVGDVRSNGAGAAVQALGLSGVGDITSVVVLVGTYDDWVGVDQIVYTDAVPAPGAAGLVGLAALGAARRRRV